MRIVRQNVALSPDGSAVTATCSASMSSLDAMVNEIDHDSGRPLGCEAAELLMLLTDVRGSSTLASRT